MFFVSQLIYYECFVERSFKLRPRDFTSGFFRALYSNLWERVFDDRILKVFNGWVGKARPREILENRGGVATGHS